MSTPLDPRLQEQARLAELGMMVAGLGHELRQPLFAIKSIAQLLQQSGGENPEMVQSLLEQVGHMEQLVEALGCYSRKPQDQGLVDVDATLAQIQRWLGPRARKAGVELRIVAGAGQAVAMDPVALTQILVNLCNNALDVAASSVDLSAECAEGVVLVRVRDDGPGLTVSAEQAFTPFVTTKEAGKGTGLGLSISRQLAEGAGGSLELLDVPVGACFVLQLPMVT